MTNDPDQIREQIEVTRGQLSQDVTVLAEEVKPSTIVRRRVGRIRGSVSRARDRVMGSASELGSSGRSSTQSAMSSVSDAAGSVSDAASGAPAKVRQETQGNPLAVGLIAFGVGWLASSLVPASRLEQLAAERVKEQVTPLAQEAGQAVKEAAQHLEEPAKQAVGSVQDTAVGAASTVQSQVGAAVSTARQAGGT